MPAKPLPSALGGVAGGGAVTVHQASANQGLQQEGQVPGMCRCHQMQLLVGHAALLSGHGPRHLGVG